MLKGDPKGSGREPTTFATIYWLYNKMHIFIKK